MAVTQLTVGDGKMTKRTVGRRRVDALSEGARVLLCPPGPRCETSRAFSLSCRSRSNERQAARIRRSVGDSERRGTGDDERMKCPCQRRNTRRTQPRQDFAFKISSKGLDLTSGLVDVRMIKILIRCQVQIRGGTRTRGSETRICTMAQRMQGTGHQGRYINIRSVSSTTGPRPNIRPPLAGCRSRCFTRAMRGLACDFTKPGRGRLGKPTGAEHDIRLLWYTILISLRFPAPVQHTLNIVLPSSSCIYSYMIPLI
jgi:hypothetical protein